MKLRICIAIIFLCALILGCVQESKNVTINNTITTPTESEGDTSQAVNKTKSISKLTTITPTPKIEQKNAIANTSKTIGQIILQYSLKTPPDTEYEWIDLNESLGVIVINGTTYETGLLGKMYVPKEIQPDREYPIYLLLSRNPEVSELAVAGITLCGSPSFVIDILNKKLDFYIHFGIGGVFGKHY